jgi:DNA-binding PucR family transcriptional regulator
VRIGRPADPAVAGEMLVTEAQAAAADLLRELSDSPLRRLEEHDARSGGELVASLRAWCRAGCDVPAAAAALHVHTNTLRYRLKRAMEVSGLDVTRPRQLLALQLVLEV